MQQANVNDCRMLEQNLAAYKAVNDMPAAVAVAKQIAKLFPRNRSLWENITAVFIDGEQVEDAAKAGGFPSTRTFIAKCKRAYGITPFQILKQQQSGNAPLMNFFFK